MTSISRQRQCNSKDILITHMPLSRPSPSRPAAAAAAAAARRHNTSRSLPWMWPWSRWRTSTWPGSCAAAVTGRRRRAVVMPWHHRTAAAIVQSATTVCSRACPPSAPWTMPPRRRFVVPPPWQRAMANLQPPSQPYYTETRGKTEEKGIVSLPKWDYCESSLSLSLSRRETLDRIERPILCLE